MNGTGGAELHDHVVQVFRDVRGLPATGIVACLVSGLRTLDLGLSDDEQRAAVAVAGHDPRATAAVLAGLCGRLSYRLPVEATHQPEGEPR